MTETSTAAAPPTRLYRDPDEGMFAGVCAAVARYTGTDPVIWRIVTAVLAVFGGTGVVLYALAWVLIPKVGEDMSLGERWLHREKRLSATALVVIAVVVVAIVAGADDGDGLFALAVLAVIAYLVHRERQGRPLAPSYTAPAVSDVTGDAPAATPLSPPAQREPRLRSRLGSITLSSAALVSGVLVLARTYGVDGLTPARIVAAALAVLGAGLVVGTWYGRARWLVFPGLLLCLALAATAATDSRTGAFRGGVGERTWVASQSAQQGFRLGIGEATLNLTQLPPEGRHVRVAAHVGGGHLIVVVPDDVTVRVHARVQVGEIREFGENIGDGSDEVERTRTYGPPGDPRVEVEASVTTGQVEVRHG